MQSVNQDIYEHLSQEQKLIIILCKIKPDQKDLDFIKSCPIDSLDWNYIYSFSQEHAVGSLIYSNISKHLDNNISWQGIRSF